MSATIREPTGRPADEHRQVRMYARLLVGAASMLAIAVASAQDAALAASKVSGSEPVEPTIALQEIVVTARRRAEDAQEVPVSITALSAIDLEQRRIVTGQDLQGQVPSLVVNPGGQSRDVHIYSLRGQSTTYTSSPAVVQYMAEVPLPAGRISSLQGSPGQFLDLVNIQVLRGPSGTLFGRNSTGGAILLEPAKPSSEFTGYVQAQAGNYSDREFEGVLNVPLSNDLMTRFAGRVVDREGYTKDVVTGADYDNREYSSGRLGVLWRPTDRVENYFMASYSKSESNGTGWVLREFNVPFYEGLFASFGLDGCAGAGLGAGCSVLTQLAADQDARGIRKISLGSAPLSSEVKGWSMVDQLDLKLSDEARLRNIVSYSELSAFSGFDGDGSPLALYDSNLPHNGQPTDDVSQITAEVQLQGTALDDDLQYTAGLYYEKVRSARRTIVDNVTFFAPGANTTTLDAESKAVYGQGSYDFGGLARTLTGLKFTAGWRYTWDESEGAGSAVFYDVDGQTVLGCGNGVIASDPSFANCEMPGKVETSSPTWTVGFDYQIDDRLLPYVKFTYGYKTGGLNLAAVNPAHSQFDPEYVETYEAGIKTTFVLGKVPVLFNVAGFHTEYEDIQVAAGDVNLDTGAAGAAVFNAASARIRGVEAEATAVLFTNLELSANFSRLDGEYDDFTVISPFGQFDCTGEFVFGEANLKCLPMNAVPELTYSITGRYTLPVPDGNGDVVLSANYAYTGEFYNTTTSPPEVEPGLKFDSIGLLNLWLSWSGVLDTALDVSLFMTNATDETYRSSVTGVYQTLGVRSDLYGEPRMYGVQLRYRW